MTRGGELLEGITFVMWIDGGLGRACSWAPTRTKGKRELRDPEDGLCSSAGQLQEGC